MPVVNDQGETVGVTNWVLSETPEFLPWWTNEPLIRLSDYEAASASDKARIAELESALSECAASLAWNCFGECRAVHDGPIMSAQMALEHSRAALQADRDQQYDMKVKAREQRDAVTAKLNAMQAECEKLRKDADMYRYIRKGNQWIVAATQTGFHIDGEDLDDIIDSEMEQQK